MEAYLFFEDMADEQTAVKRARFRKYSLLHQQATTNEPVGQWTDKTCEGVKLLQYSNVRRGMRRNCIHAIYTYLVRHLKIDYMHSAIYTTTFDAKFKEFWENSV